MSVVDDFAAKKKAESVFLSLEDGDTVKVLILKDIKPISKTGFGGEEKEVLRLKCVVETSEGARDKDFDNGSLKFVQEMQDKGVTIGSSFKITRTGVQTKTRYTISEVVNPVSISSASTAPAVATPAPVTPQVAP